MLRFYVVSVFRTITEPSSGSMITCPKNVQICTFDMPDQVG